MALGDLNGQEKEDFHQETGLLSEEGERETELLIDNAVNDSLRASQDLKSCTTFATKEFLRIIKERSLKVLYEKNSSCFIRLKNNHLTITPFNKEKRGLNLSEDKSIILSYDTITDKDYYIAIMSSL